jgi:hypothetical protein
MLTGRDGGSLYTVVPKKDIYHHANDRCEVLFTSSNALFFNLEFVYFGDLKKVWMEIRGKGRVV